MRYVARAPLRIDFGGGWTDDPLYAGDEGGAVLNVAITRYAHGAVSFPGGEGMLQALRSGRRYLSYTVDAPAGAGLGARAAENVLWATLMRSSIENTSSREDIARMATNISELLGILGGKQDEYASALGGFNFLTVTDKVMVERLRPEPPVVDALRARLLVVYTGPSRLSPEIYAQVWQRYRSGESGIRPALSALARTAGDMKRALLAGDLEAFGGLINENWARQKELHPAVTTPEIEALIARARTSGAAAAKVCGSGGGGCVLLVAQAGETERLRTALSSRRTPALEFDFDTYGVHLRKA